MPALCIPAPDLTLRPPRSPHVSLGGYVILPRLLDKGRAQLAGKTGGFIFNSGIDKRFFAFVKIEAEALLDQLAEGKGDGAILEWIKTHAGHQPSDWEIAQWSAFQVSRTASSVEARENSVSELAALAPERTDIITGFQLIDLEDHVSFGGIA
jgi:hypothetical protein